MATLQFTAYDNPTAACPSMPYDENQFVDVSIAHYELTCCRHSAYFLHCYALLCVAQSKTTLVLGHSDS